MLITDRLIYLEMEKTGSTHINHLLSLCFPVELIGKHTSIESYIDGYKTDKCIIGSVRNPWDWYVSLWAQGCTGSGRKRLKGGLYKGLTSRKLISKSFFIDDTGDFSLTLRTFGDMWNEMTKPINVWSETYKSYECPKLFRKWLKLILEKRQRDLVRVWPLYVKMPLPQTFGLMTYKYCSYFVKDFPTQTVVTAINNIDDLKEFDEQNNILDATIKIESLEDDLVRAIQKAGYDVDDKILNIIEEGKFKRINKSKRYNTGFYYNDETIALVESKEKFLIDKYSYTKPVI